MHLHLGKETVAPRLPLPSLFFFFCNSSLIQSNLDTEHKEKLQHDPHLLPPYIKIKFYKQPKKKAQSSKDIRRHNSAYLVSAPSILPVPKYYSCFFQLPPKWTSFLRGIHNLTPLYSSGSVFSNIGNIQMCGLKLPEFVAIVS